MSYLELLLMVVGAVLLPLLILSSSWRVQLWLMALELPLLAWLTWLVATYKR